VTHRGHRTSPNNPASPIGPRRVEPAARTGSRPSRRSPAARRGPPNRAVVAQDSARRSGRHRRNEVAWRKRSPWRWSKATRRPASARGAPSSCRALVPAARSIRGRRQRRLAQRRSRDGDCRSGGGMVRALRRVQPCAWPRTTSTRPLGGAPRRRRARGERPDAVSSVPANPPTTQSAVRSCLTLIIDRCPRDRALPRPSQRRRRDPRPRNARTILGHVGSVVDGVRWTSQRSGKCGDE